MKRISASPLFTQHFNRQKVYFLGRLSRLTGGAPLGAAASEAAFLANQRAEALPGCVCQTEGHDGQNQKMLKPEGHVS